MSRLALRRCKKISTPRAYPREELRMGGSSSGLKTRPRTRRGSYSALLRLQFLQHLAETFERRPLTLESPPPGRLELALAHGLKQPRKIP